MPLKKGKTNKILHQNISELLGTYKKSGKIGTSKPKSKKAAQKQAAAIAYSKMDEIASKYVDKNTKLYLSEMYHEDEARLNAEGHAALDDVVCECNDCVYWFSGNRCHAPKIHLIFADNVRGQRICECNTYRPHSEEEEASDKFQELDDDQDEYGDTPLARELSAL